MQSPTKFLKFPTTPHLRTTHLHSPPARPRLEAWVRRYGTNSASYVLLEGPKSYFKSPNVDGFIAYQLCAGVAVIGGDPICSPEEAPRLIQDFVKAMKNKPVGAYQVSTQMLDAFRVSGFGDVQVGKEAIFDLRKFSLAGGQLELVRAATNKAKRAGIVVIEHQPFSLGAKSINDELCEVSEEWLRCKGQRELGFLLGSVGLDQRSAKRYFIARSANGAGRIEGFIVCEPIYGRNGFYLDVTRRRVDAVRGTMELLTAEIFKRLRDEGYDMASMGLAPLALLDDPDLRAHPRITRLMRLAYQQVSNSYDFKLLYRYKAKYHPHAWERRYLCFNQRRLSPRMLYAVIQVRNGITLNNLLKRRRGEVKGIHGRINSWKHAASFVIGICSALLSSS